MASLILLFSELVRHHNADPTAFLAAHPYNYSSSCAGTAATSTAGSFAESKSLRNYESNKHNEKMVMENYLQDSRICVDFVWP
ncbi:hypothetical protein O6P43_009888 [Quillaja saponaria]|uniref:Uncharacterized protein n=1 Tax=Quillaja saponaria TaxID=32244 RepID=A0AAD7PZ77_QUISA|nr:hypothetical protein O6P43_009888 [Quillaja saponaria]